MVPANSFEGVTATVFPSQDYEVVIAKQAVLSEHGRELRQAVNQLPPEVTKSLLSEYGRPSDKLISSIEDAVILREFAIERATQETGLDKTWLTEAAPRNISEQNLGADDMWNSPEP